MTAAPAVQRHGSQSFARYEFKYLLNRELRQRIESEIAHFMTYDGFVDPERENTYPVRSLYFDNQHATHYLEKIDGVKTRKKFRIRTYGDYYRQGLPIFLEIKGRHNERTYKERVQIEREHLELFCHPKEYLRILDLYPRKSVTESFVFDRIRRQVAPAVLVDYVRRPYTSSFDGSFRVTFDSQLSASPTDDLYPGPDRRWYECLPGWTVLEIKFDRRIPAWFHRILQAHDLRRVSISKFCKGMETCGLAVDLS
jgi:hypothetical protein